MYGRYRNVIFGIGYDERLWECGARTERNPFEIVFVLHTVLSAAPARKSQYSSQARTVGPFRHSIFMREKVFSFGSRWLTRQRVCQRRTVFTKIGNSTIHLSQGNRLWSYPNTEPGRDDSRNTVADLVDPAGFVWLP